MHFELLKVDILTILTKHKLTLDAVWGDPAGAGD